MNAPADVTACLYAAAASALAHGRPELAEAVERIADEHLTTQTTGAVSDN